MPTFTINLGVVLNGANPDPVRHRLIADYAWYAADDDNGAHNLAAPPTGGVSDPSAAATGHGPADGPNLLGWVQSGAPFGSIQTQFHLAGGSLPPGIALVHKEVRDLFPGGFNPWPVGILNEFGFAGVPTQVGDYTSVIGASGAFGGDTFIWHIVLPLRPGGGGVTCPFITITPSTLHEFALNVLFSQQLTATSGVAPYVWDVAYGSLPPGITLSSSGLLAGAPTLVGTYSFTIRATDTNGTGCVGVRAYTITVLGEPTPTDYWTDPPLGFVFPSRRVMIMSPNVGTNYSRGKTVTMVSGTPLTRYPATNLVDDSADSPLRVSERQVELYVDLGAARTPDAVALLNHNIDSTRLVEVLAAVSSPSAFGLVASFAAGRVNGWLDLRGFTARTARYWKIRVTSNNSAPITMGELVIGSAYFLEGVVDPDWKRKTKYFVSREFTEEMLPYKMHSGTRLRQVEIGFTLDPANRALLETVFDDAGTTGNRVLVVPDTGKNDPYFIDWPSRRAISFPQSLREAKIQLLLTEQAGGVV